MNMHLKTAALSGILMLCFIGVHAAGGFLNLKTQWSNWGQNKENTSHNPDSLISKSQVAQLEELCKIDVTKDGGTTTTRVSSKPTIVGDSVYWTAYSGKIGAAKVVRDKKGRFVSCKTKWVRDVPTILGLAGAAEGFTGPVSSRISPAYYERKGKGKGKGKGKRKGTLLFLAINNVFSMPLLDPNFNFLKVPPFAFALDAETGELVWNVKSTYKPFNNQPAITIKGVKRLIAKDADINPDAVLANTSSSPRIYKGKAYFGFSSFNNLSFFDGIPLTFRGHMVSLNLKSLKVKTEFTLPKKPQS